MIVFKNKDKLTEAGTNTASNLNSEEQVPQQDIYDFNSGKKIANTEPSNTNTSNIQQGQTVVNDWAGKFDPNKKYVYTNPKTGKTYQINFAKADGHPWYRDENQQVYRPPTNEIKEAEPEQPQYTRTQIASANSQVLQMFKDGTEVKNLLLNKTIPINDILIQNGNIIVENKHEETNRILESLNIKCPDYLLLTEAETINANGQTSLNSLFSDEVQQVLNATGKQITWIHNENGNVVLYDANKQNYTLDSIKQQADQIAQKSKEEEEAKKQADEEAKKQAAENAKVGTKMSKQDINLISSKVLNALNSKLKKWEGYNISWEIVPEGFDVNTLKENKLNEDLRQTLTNIKNKIGTALGTNSGRENSMTIRSMPTTFAVRPTLVNEEGDELTKEDKYYDTIMKGLWTSASKILNNYVEIQPTDDNGQQYKTTATFKLQPSVKDGVFTYKAVADVKPSNTNAQGEVANTNNNVNNGGSNNKAVNQNIVIPQGAKKVVTKTKRNGTTVTKVKYGKNGRQKSAFNNFMPSAHKMSMR